jgi:maltokinase
VTERPATDAGLVEWLQAQRWFGAKGRDVAGAGVVASIRLAPDLELAVAEVLFAAGTHELYQLLPLDDPAAGRRLAALLRDEATVPVDADAEVRFRWFDDAGRPSSEPEVRPMGAEQSNSSIVVDGAWALKAFRRLEAGDNPELEMLRFLTEHGFDAIAPLSGAYELQSELVDATLGVVQRFVAGGRDGWDLVLDALADGRGEGVLDDLEELGRVVGRMHTVLAADSSDPAFAPEEPSPEALALLTATIDEDIERAFRDLPRDAPVLAPIAGRGQEIRDRLGLLTQLAVGGRVIRQHGDLHLGQTMHLAQRPVDGDAAPRSPWVILDFEGEPARPLLERRRKRSPLRDVAGMLRSFAYAGSAAGIQRGAEMPEGWEDAARERFLNGYFETVDQSLLPPAQGATRTLLTVFELEKAVYELRYELDNRPDWVAIPVAGIARLLEEPVA